MKPLSVILLAHLVAGSLAIPARKLPSFCLDKPDSWFVCETNRMCISRLDVCNGINDCPDGSDEVNCKCSKKNKCPAGQKCRVYHDEATSECSDCPKGKRFIGDQCSDQNECLFKYKDVCKSKGSCVNYDGGYTCVKCPRGFQARMVDERLFLSIFPNGTFKPDDSLATLLLCEDKNECARSDVCDGKPEECVNRIGEFACGCPSDHVRSNGETVCRALGEQPLIAIAEEFEITVFDLHTEKEVARTKANDPIVDLVSMDDQVIFFATQRQIWEFRVATKQRELIVDLDLSAREDVRNSSTIRQLSVDWLHKRIYYLTQSSISAADLQGRSLVVVEKTLVDSIAVDATTQQLFYSKRGRVYSNDLRELSAPDTEIFTAPGLGATNDEHAVLAVDAPLERLYYIHDRVLYTFDYEGQNRVIIPNPAQFRHLEPFEDRLFATYNAEAMGVVKMQRVGYTSGLTSGSDNVLAFSGKRARSLTILQSTKFPHSTIINCSGCRSGWCYRGEGCLCDDDGEPECSRKLTFERLRPRVVKTIFLEPTPSVSDKPKGSASSPMQVPTRVVYSLILIPVVVEVMRRL